MTGQGTRSFCLRCGSTDIFHDPRQTPARIVWELPDPASTRQPATPKPSRAADAVGIAVAVVIVACWAYYLAFLYKT